MCSSAAVWLSWRRRNGLFPLTVLLDLTSSFAPIIITTAARGHRLKSILNTSPAEPFAPMTYAVVFLMRHVNVPEGATMWVHLQALRRTKMLRSNIHIHMVVVKPVFQREAILLQVKSRSYEQVIASSFIALWCYSSLEAVLSSHCCCCEVNT